VLNSTKSEALKAKERIPHVKITLRCSIFFCVKDIKYISLHVFFVFTMLMRGVQTSEIATVGQEFGKMRRATSCDCYLPKFISFHCHLQISRLMRTLCKFLANRFILHYIHSIHAIFEVMKASYGRLNHSASAKLSARS
jgi:hypothetical protein